MSHKYTKSTNLKSSRFEIIGGLEYDETLQGYIRSLHNLMNDSGKILYNDLEIYGGEIDDKIIAIGSYDNGNDGNDSDGSDGSDDSNEDSDNRNSSNNNIKTILTGGADEPINIMANIVPTSTLNSEKDELGDYMNAVEIDSFGGAVESTNIMQFIN